MTFRQSREEDYLGSYLRRHVFKNLLQRELTLDAIFGRASENYDPGANALLTDDSNPLSKWQDEDAADHWQCEPHIYFTLRVFLVALNMYCLPGPPVMSQAGVLSSCFLCF